MKSWKDIRPGDILHMLVPVYDDAGDLVDVQYDTTEVLDVNTEHWVNIIDIDKEPRKLFFNDSHYGMAVLGFGFIASDGYRNAIPPTLWRYCVSYDKGALHKFYETTVAIMLSYAERDYNIAEKRLNSIKDISNKEVI